MAKNYCPNLFIAQNPWKRMKKNFTPQFVVFIVIMSDALYIWIHTQLKSNFFTFAEYDWELEQKRVIEIVPVMEAFTTTKTEKLLFAKSTTLNLFEDSTTLSLILNKLNRIYFRKSQNKDLRHAFENGHLFRCSDLDRLEKNTKTPFLKQDFIGTGFINGVLHIDQNLSFSTTTHIIERHITSKKVEQDPKSTLTELKYSTNYDFGEEAFLRGVDELNKLLDMQSWTGIPRLYGICLMSSNGSDVMDLRSKNRETAIRLVRSVKYVIIDLKVLVPLVEMLCTLSATFIAVLLGKHYDYNCAT